MFGLIEDLEPHDDVYLAANDEQAKATVVEVAGVARPERETTTQPAPQGQVRQNYNLPEVWRTEQACCASPAAVRLTGSWRRCWRSCCGSMGLAHSPPSIAGPRDLRSTHSMRRLSPWSSSPTPSSAEVRRICVTWCVGFDKNFLPVPYWSGSGSRTMRCSGISAAQGMAGATSLASSLHDAVTKCLEEARKVQQPGGERRFGRWRPRRGFGPARRSRGALTHGQGPTCIFVFARRR